MNPINGQEVPQQQPGMPVEQPFNEWHNNVYNGLRDTLQKYSAAGVPGMDKIVDTLNKLHLNYMKSYVPQNQPEGQGGAGPQIVRPNMSSRNQPMPQQNQSGISFNPFGSLNTLMQGIINRNAPQTSPYTNFTR